jgi:quinol-cytochrome oxidoreductase complex cytochrome b subunit
MSIPYCPITGKFYIIVIWSIIFTCLLTSINIQKADIDKIRIFLNIISILLFIYIIKIDIQKGVDSKGIKECLNHKLIFFIFTIFSIYLLVFGILGLNEYSAETEYSTLTYITIASLIFGAIGLLYIFNEIIYSFMLIH